jgi:CHAT domain-containing protein
VRAFLLAGLFFLLSISGVPHAQPGVATLQPGVAALEPGQSIDAVLAGDRPLTYRIDVGADRVARLTVDAHGGAAVVRLFDERSPQEPDIEVATADNDDPTVTISLVGHSSGQYRLEITHDAGSPQPCHVELSVAAPSRPEDERRAAAERAYAAAQRPGVDASPAAERQHLKKFEEALELWRACGDRAREALTLSHLARIRANLGDMDQAASISLQALELGRATAEAHAQAIALASLGTVARRRGDLQTALARNLEALPLLARTTDRRTEMTTRLEVGIVYADMGEPARAIDAYEQGLLLARALHDRAREVNALANISAAYRQLGEPEKAMGYLQSGLEVSRDAGDARLRAALLRMTGAALYDRGDVQQSLEYYAQALPLQRDLGDDPQQAVTQASIALAYERLGDTDKALDYFRESLAVRAKIGDRRGQAISLAHIGLVHAEAGDARQALVDFQQALALHRAVANRKGEADTMAYLGDVYAARHGYEDARQHYADALAFYRSAGHAYEEVDALTRLGAVDVSLHHSARAFESLDRALAQAHSLGSSFQEAESLFQLARAERERGRPIDALARIQEAVDLTERTRGTVAGPDARASYLAKVRDRYEFLVSLLMDLQRQQPHAGYDARALEASERAHARGLLDWLAESHADIHEGVDPDLIKQERALEATLQAKTAYRIQLLGRVHSASQAAAADEVVAALTRDYDEIESRVRARSPRYAALTQPVTLRVPDIQRLLDPETTLLEYALGEDQSVAWVVQHNALRAYELPGRAQIEDVVRQAYADVSVNGAARRRAASDALSRMVIAPVAREWDTSTRTKRLAIVADGALQYVPFAALQRADGSPLIASFEIVNLPSASALSALRHDADGRQQAPKLVAVFADPVFERADPRVVSGRPAAPPRQPVDDRLPPAAKPTAPLTFDRLLASRDEATAIVALASAAAGSGSTLAALDFDASRATATSAELSRYRIVHFASHTLINSQRPQLSGLVLSLVDRNGRAADGFVPVHDIFNLKLNADLVVLSACQTALGKNVWGEGLVGLTRAFMYAGTARVVASLWEVPDRATAELMKRFYARMLQDGLPPAAALRHAQLDVMRHAQWSSPYYWAGFTIQGDWQGHESSGLNK